MEPAAAATKTLETEPVISAAEPAATEPATTSGPAGEESGEPTIREVEEPQNALTKKFTDAEWKALKELKANLAQIIKEAYTDTPDKTSTTIYNVPLDPNGPPDARVSVILMKFLRARNLNVAEAQTMLIATLRWREEFKVDELMKEEFPPEIFGNLGHLYGQDKGGRPVNYNLYGGDQDLKAIFGDIPRFLRWRVQLMEKGVALLDFETIDQMLQLHDYEGVSMMSRDASQKSAAAEATAIFQNHYPEFLFKKFFVNVPRLFTWMFWLFKPLLSAQTLAKMNVVGAGSQTIGKELLPLVDADELPKRYGGTADALL